MFVCVQVRGTVWHHVQNMSRHDGITHTHMQPKVHLHKHTQALPSPCLSSEGNHTSAWLHRPDSYKIKDRFTYLEPHRSQKKYSDHLLM